MIKEGFEGFGQLHWVEKLLLGSFWEGLKGLGEFYDVRTSF
jgi:hypothetical protein